MDPTLPGEKDRLARKEHSGKIRARLRIIKKPEIVLAVVDVKTNFDWNVC